MDKWKKIGSSYSNLNDSEKDHMFQITTLTLSLTSTALSYHSKILIESFSCLHFSIYQYLNQYIATSQIRQISMGDVRAPLIISWINWPIVLVVIKIIKCSSEKNLFRLLPNISISIDNFFQMFESFWFAIVPIPSLLVFLTPRINLSSTTKTTPSFLYDERWREYAIFSQYGILISFSKLYIFNPFLSQEILTADTWRKIRDTL